MKSLSRKMLTQFAACIAVLLLLAKIDNRQYGQMEDINLARFLKEQASYLQKHHGRHLLL